MTLYQWLSLLGVPALLFAAGKYVLDQTKALRLGIQALLRAELVSVYNDYTDRQYAPIYARENFENCWKQYHALGANGVIDDLRAKFLSLPTEPPDKPDNTEVHKW